MDKPKSANTEAEIEAAAQLSSDPRLRARLERKHYGDGLDRLALRDGLDDWAGIVLLAFGVAMYCAGEIPFAWQAGVVVLPGLEVNGWHFGGLVAVFNSLIFILAVFMFIADGRKFFAVRGGKANRWSSIVAGTAALALFAIYTAQTQAADEVRAIVDKRVTLEDDIRGLEVKIRETNDTMPSRKAAELAMERAQDEAVGSHLNTVTDGEAKILCAKVSDFEERMQCKQKILRASVDCTQDVSTNVRDSACDPIKAAQMQIARIDEMETLQALRAADIEKKKAELKALPEASNYFIRQIADQTKWTIPDAQSRVYFFIGLLLLFVPAAIFAKVVVRKPDAPTPTPSP